jgi:hypothetical protein
MVYGPWSRVYGLGSRASFSPLLGLECPTLTPKQGEALNVSSSQHTNAHARLSVGALRLCRDLVSDVIGLNHLSLRLLPVKDCCAKLRVRDSSGFQVSGLGFEVWDFRLCEGLRV